MARIRTIKPEFWRHEQLSDLPEPTHMLAAALLNYADDEGYFNANPKLIKAECCPLREPSVSIHDSLTALANMGYLVLGKSADGRSYGCIVKFSDHQRVNRPVPSKIKCLDISWDGSLPAHTQLTEPSPPEGKGREEEGKGSESARPHTIPDEWKPKDPNANPAEVSRFKADRKARGIKRVDWDAEWDLWCSRIADYGEAPPAKPQGTPVATTWVAAADPRWAALAGRYQTERHKPPPAIVPRGGEEMGWHFPTDWLEPRAH